MHARLMFGAGFLIVVCALQLLGDTGPMAQTREAIGAWLNERIIESIERPSEARVLTRESYAGLIIQIDDTPFSKDDIRNYLLNIADVDEKIENVFHLPFKFGDHVYESHVSLNMNNSDCHIKIFTRRKLLIP